MGKMMETEGCCPLWDQDRCQDFAYSLGSCFSTAIAGCLWVGCRIVYIWFVLNCLYFILLYFIWFYLTLFIFETLFIFDLYWVVHRKYFSTAWIFWMIWLITPGLGTVILFQRLHLNLHEQFALLSLGTMFEGSCLNQGLLFQSSAVKFWGKESPLGPQV